MSDILYYRYAERMDMSRDNIITMGSRGTITLPSKTRKSLGLKQGATLIVEQTPKGILLKPAAVSVYPLEIYSDERIEEFNREDKATPEELERLKKKVQ
jgi:AbrB family looped-hinge helix DNA binding protein